MQNKNKTRSIHCLSSHRTGFKDGCCIYIYIYIYVYIEFKWLFKITIIYIHKKQNAVWLTNIFEENSIQIYIYIYILWCKKQMCIYT